MEWLKEVQYDCKQIGNPQYEKVRIIIQKETTEFIKKKSKRLMNTKSFGLLVGNKYKDKDYILIYIEKAVPLGNISTASSGSFFTDKRWNKIKKWIQKNNPGKEIVGWYGVRSGWEAMATEEDQRINQNFFDKPWQIIYLLDKKNNAANFYYWHQKRLNRCRGYYQLEDNINSKKNKTIKVAGNLFKGIVLITIILLFAGLYTKFVHPYIAGFDNKDMDFMEDSSLNNRGEEVTYLQKQNSEQSQNEKSESLESDKTNSEMLKEDIKNLDSEDVSEKVKEDENININQDEKVSAIESTEYGTNEQNQQEELQDIEDISENEDDVVVHIIEKGDTLIKISKKYYGDSSYSSALGKINRISDTRSLRVGDYLIIPPKDKIEKLK